MSETRPDARDRFERSSPDGDPSLEHLWDDTGDEPVDGRKAPPPAAPAAPRRIGGAASPSAEPAGNSGAGRAARRRKNPERERRAPGAGGAAAESRNEARRQAVESGDAPELPPFAAPPAHLAYGRYEQAEEVLRHALEQNPDRDEYKLKRLEIHYATENRRAFQNYAWELKHQGADRKRDFWDKVLEMGRELLPDAPLFKARFENNALDEKEEVFEESASEEKENTPAAATPSSATDSGINFDISTLVRELAEASEPTREAPVDPDDLIALDCETSPLPQKPPAQSGQTLDDLLRDRAAETEEEPPAAEPALEPDRFPQGALPETLPTEAARSRTEGDTPERYPDSPFWPSAEALPPNPPSDAENVTDHPEDDVVETDAPPRSKVPLILAALAAVGLLAGFLRVIRSDPTAVPPSPAFEAERGPPLEIGGAPPLPTEPEPLGDPRAEDGPSIPEPIPDRAAPPAGETGRPEPEAVPPPGPPKPAEPASPADPERLDKLADTLAAHRALIERLEQRERVLDERLAGLELALRQRNPEDLPAAGRKPARARSLPPSTTVTTSPTVKTSPRRENLPLPPLPFSVASVDTWNGQPTVVARIGGRLVDLKPGDRHGGYRIESAQGQTVTIRAPDGALHTVRAGSGDVP
jgi:tetratricopeptide (TPR) repeat protein